jgi:hypothetical protein
MLRIEFSYLRHSIILEIKMENTPIKLLESVLVGKKLTHTNQHRREVSLEIESVKVKHNNRQITPDTPANDWWGESCDWDTIVITFIDGSSIEVNLNSDLKLC